MKNGLCPKCSSQDIVRVPGYSGAYGSGNHIPFSIGIISYPILVTRYVCGQCGFSEEWIEEPDSLDNLKKKYQKAEGDEPVHERLYYDGTPIERET